MRFMRDWLGQHYFMICARFNKSSLREKAGILMAIVLLLVSLATPAHAAITYRSSSSANNGSGATSLVITTPSGAATGDVLIASVDMKISSGTKPLISPPTGWNQETSDGVSTTFVHSTFSYVLTSAPAASYTFNFYTINPTTNVSTSTTAKGSGGMTAYTGVDSQNPVNAKASTYVSTAATTMTAPSVTTTVPNAMIVATFGAATGTTVTAGGGMTLRYQDASTGGNASTRETSAAQDALQAAVGGTGPISATLAASATYSATTLALAPYIPASLNQTSYRLFANQDATGAATSFSMAAKTDYATGANPQGVATGDFNGDSKLDIVTANNSANTVSVLLNTGTGTFGTKNDFAASTGPIGVTTGDVNGDGKIDIVVADGGAKLVSVLLGNGDGTFGAAINLTVGGQSQAVALADVNADGKPDIISANTSTSQLGGGSISVLLNSGSGTFGAYTDFSTSAGATDVAIADVNGDGTPDAVVSCTDNTNVTGSVAVLMGTGGGSFATATDYNDSLGSPMQGVATGDFNGDGKLDIASGAYGYGTDVFLNGGTGTFGSPVAYGNTGVYDVAAVDMNADGKTDIVTANNTQNNASILLSNGDGTFMTMQNFTTGTNALALAVADLNGDGKPDVAVPANNATGTVSVLLNTSSVPMDVGTALAAQNTAATTPGDSRPFRMRMDVGVAGSSLAAAGRNFKLQYAPMTTSCDASFTNTPATAYADVTDTSTIRYYDNPNSANGVTLHANTNDPTDGTNTTANGGVTLQTYQEKATTTFSNASAIPVGKDGMWDFALTTSGATPGQHYCLRLVYGSGTALDAYGVIPEVIARSISLSQSDYRLYGNADSLTPGTPLAAQDTPVSVTANTSFRLRQLITPTIGSIASGTSYKLQAGEKVSTCSAASFTDLTPVTSSSTGLLQTASSIVNDSVSPEVAWSNLPKAQVQDNMYASAVASNTVSSFDTGFLIATGFGMNVPAGATITGIEVQYGAGGVGYPIIEKNVDLVKGGVVQTSTDHSQALTINSASTSVTRGGSTDLWGASLTPADVNDPGFGVAIKFTLPSTGTPDYNQADVDYMAVNVYYTQPSGSGVMPFTDNASVADNAATATTVNDPAPSSGSTVAQTYNEDGLVTAANSVASGASGLWDFALLATPSNVGKTYCFRMVAGDGTLLDSYGQYPEVTVTAAGPTLDQQVRGGQSVVNGVKRGFLF